MAALVCWASGLLEVMMDKDVPIDSGPIVLTTGTAGRLRTEMTAHGVVDEFKAWYVPGTREVLALGRTVLQVERERMDLVIAFNEMLRFKRVKAKKGLRAAKLAQLEGV